MKGLSTRTIKSVVIAIVFAMVFTMMPMSCFAASKFKAPKNTKLTSCKLTDSREVTLKWKKVKGVTGYKVYRKKENTNAVCIAKIKKSSKVSYVDTLDKYDFGEIRYHVVTYKTKDKKTKVSDKGYTNRKTVKIKDMAWDPSTEPVNDEIYAAYKRASSNDISLDAIRALMLYGVNKEREKYYGDTNHALQQLDILNETAQEKCVEMEKNGEFSHTLSTIGSMMDQLTDKNFRNFGLSGENIAHGFCVRGAIAAWMDSSKHRANMLKNAYTHVGIGFYKGNSTLQFIQYSDTILEDNNWVDCSKYFN